MRKNLLIGNLVLALTGEEYVAYQVINEDPNVKRDISEINEDSLVVPSFDSDTIHLCSFKIQFLGNLNKRDNVALADLLKTFRILGVMNIEDNKERDNAVPAGFVPLNEECRRTNTLINNSADSVSVRRHTCFQQSNLQLSFHV